MKLRIAKKIYFNRLWHPRMMQASKRIAKAAKLYPELTFKAAEYSFARFSEMWKRIDKALG